MLNQALIILRTFLPRKMLKLLFFFQALLQACSDYLNKIVRKHIYSRMKKQNLTQSTKKEFRRCDNKYLSMPSMLRNTKLGNKKPCRKLKAQALSEVSENMENMTEELIKVQNKHTDIQRNNFLRKILLQYVGKNFPVLYKEQYKFAQQCQENFKKQEKSNPENYDQLSSLQIAAISLLMLVYIFSLWFCNINHFFGNDKTSDLYFSVYIIAIVAMALDCTCKYQYQQKELSYGIVSVFCFFLQHLIAIAYLTLKITNVMSTNSHLWILELIFSYFVCLRISQLYGKIRFLKLRLYHTYQSKILDLILTLLVILHIVAIILFSASKTDYEKTWVSQIKSDIQPLNEFTLYLYAFYFGTTTILTVGYGDIAAKNPIQVGVVILVEIIGILMFSYLINQIGYSISTLRKGREVIENDLSVLQKMKKHYHMKDDVTNQARNFLINHKPDSNLLEPTSENNVLVKLNQTLRNDIVNSNNLGIVKSSLFFLTKWSNSFQRSIASKLTHRLFPPEDLIYQPLGNQRIYIFKTGRVNVYAQRSSQKKYCNNALKVINCNLAKQVSDNSYGYTAVISKRPSKIYAYSKDFTSSYFVDKTTFMSIVNQRIKDFELFHQILAKMDLQKFSQVFETPLLGSNRHHYVPTKMNIIRRHKKYSAKQVNPRYTLYERTLFRNQKKKHFLQNSKKIEKMIRKRSESKEQQIINIEEEQQSKVDEVQVLKLLIQNLEKESWKNDFQIFRQYANYFSAFNYQKVLLKYQTRTIKFVKFQKKSSAFKQISSSCSIQQQLRKK